MKALLAPDARLAPGGMALVAEVIGGKVQYRPAPPGARLVDAFLTRVHGPADTMSAAGRGHRGVLVGIELCEPADQVGPEAGTAVYYCPDARRLTCEAGEHRPLVGYVAETRVAKIAGRLTRVCSVEVIAFPERIEPEPERIEPEPEPDTSPPVQEAKPAAKARSPRKPA